LSLQIGILNIPATRAAYFGVNAPTGKDFSTDYSHNIYVELCEILGPEYGNQNIAAAGIDFS
jgi:hypothetical protein